MNGFAKTIAALKTSLSAKIWADDKDTLVPFLEEWRGRWAGNALLLLRPRTTQEVAEIVKICAAHKTPITVQGGNTGLVGGQIPQGEILLSTQNLNRVRHVDFDDMSMIVEAGVTLQNAQIAADNIGLKFPLSLASQGTCTIGGNLSTNAGGVHVVKYGSAKDLVFGVEAVLPNGEILSELTTLRKDNTGYDLSKLLLGAEGTLGVITAASLKLFPKPKKTVRVMAALASPKHALELLNLARVGNYLSMFELIPELGMDYVTAHIPSMRSPFMESHPWYVLIDWEFDIEGAAQGFAENILERAVNQELLSDAVIASSGHQANELLSLRENLSAAQKPIGATIKHDITVPISLVPEFIERANKAVTKHIPYCRPLPFGHLGDGNIHYNIGQPEGMSGAKFMAQEENINNVIYDIVDALGGSISAEHGIGILKKEQLAKRSNPAKINMMKTIKTALDPDGILSPRNIF